ncbi:MAG: LysR substrate-binding domain-containing protein, partial [Hyphomicrobiaceae bacterium]
MPRDIDMSLLRAFVAVVDTGSVTGAAHLLNRTQAAVSLQIKRLEDLLGQELFLREHKRLHLAPAGERLLGNAQRLLSMNDEVWGQMTTPSFEGEVRLGVPADIVPTYIPPILRRFNAAWPRVRISLACMNSMELLEELDKGHFDLTLTTDTPGGSRSEALRFDRLVWVGIPGGDVHLREPLPISIGGQTCRFRKVVLDALRQADRDWRMVIEVSNYEAINATVAAGLAVTAALRDSIPEGFEILGSDSGLPDLPEFAINLTLPMSNVSDIAQELACHVRAEFAVRFSEGKPNLQCRPHVILGQSQL